LDMLDADRASLLAPSARRASPYCSFRRDLGDHVRSAPLRSLAVGARLCREQNRRLLEQMLALPAHEVLGVERLARVHGRAVDGASAAFKARRHVEELFPGVLLDLRDAERFGGLEVLDRRESAARAEVSEEQIQRSEDQMAQLGEGEAREQQ